MPMRGGAGMHRGAVGGVCLMSSIWQGRIPPFCEFFSISPTFKFDLNFKKINFFALRLRLRLLCYANAVSK